MGDIGEGSARRSSFLRFECSILFLDSNKPLAFCLGVIVEDNGVFSSFCMLTPVCINVSVVLRRFPADSLNVPFRGVTFCPLGVDQFERHNSSNLAFAFAVNESGFYEWKIDRIKAALKFLLE